MIAYLVMIPIGYLLGAIPFGLILGKLFRGVDVREYGSGENGYDQCHAHGRCASCASFARA